MKKLILFDLLLLFFVFAFLLIVVNISESASQRERIFEVRVYPVDSCDDPLVFAYSFSTLRGALDFARLVSHRGLEVEFCPPGPGIQVLFPAIRRIEIRRRVCIGPCPVADAPCVLQYR